MTSRPAFALDLPRGMGRNRTASRRRGGRRFEPFPLGTSRPWRWDLLGSTALHGAILGAVVLLERLPQTPAEKAAPSTPAAQRAITMMYLPPEPKPMKEVKPQPRTLPQPERAEVAPPLSPASSSPLTNSTRSGFVREELTVRPESDDPVAIARTPGAPATATSTLSRDELMVSEARRIFGGREPARQAGDDGMLGPEIRAGRPLYLPTGGGRCLNGSPAAPAPADRAAEGVVAGIVRHASNGALLPGAFLQILGTRYSTFADDHGRYRLTFDPSLVGPCRTQVVRVTATGYRAQNLILAVGSADNTILMSRR